MKTASIFPPLTVVCEYGIVAPNMFTSKNHTNANMMTTTTGLDGVGRWCALVDA